MSPPSPLEGLDEPELVGACRAHQEGAFEELKRRHGAMVEAIVIRVVDERRGGALAELRPCVHVVLESLQSDADELFATWQAGSSLRHLLAVTTRQLASLHLQDVTVRNILRPPPTPAALHLEEVIRAESARQISAVIDRLSPNVAALIRLRFRGFDSRGMADTLGIPESAVITTLTRIAPRLAELSAADGSDATLVWRWLLGAASIEERVAAALRAEDEPAFHETLETIQAALRAVRERAFLALHPRQDNCFDEATIGSFVDGSLKGTARSRAEGHVVTCARCADTVAALISDMGVVAPLRDAAHLDPDVTMAAACIATGRSNVGLVLASEASRRGADRAPLLARLSRIGMALDGVPPSELPSEPSQVVTSSRLVADEEAPLLAMEALLDHDPATASRAIDHLVAKHTLGARLRLLAAVAGDDPREGRSLADAIRGRPRSDPALADDAAAALVLPEDRALPRVILMERLRSILPQAVRFAVAG